MHHRSQAHEQFNARLRPKNSCQFLRSVPLFSQLQDDDLRVLIGLVTRETIQAGRDVYRQSDDDKTLYIVYSGEIRLIHIDPTGVPNDVGLAQQGRMLGESALLLAEPHDVTALALTDVVTLAFKRETFMPLREQSPAHVGAVDAQRSRSPSGLNAPHYGWQAADEAVVLFTREHWWGLLRRMFFPLLALLGDRSHC